MLIRKLSNIFCSFIFKIQKNVSLPASQKKTRLFPYKTQKQKHGATSTTGRQPANLLDDQQRRRAKVQRSIDSSRAKVGRSSPGDLTSKFCTIQVLLLRLGISALILGITG